jgi:hypothetical protein
MDNPENDFTNNKSCVRNNLADVFLHVLPHEQTKRWYNGYGWETTDHP